MNTHSGAIHRLGGLIDSLVYAVSPERGVKRMAARRMSEAVQNRAERIRNSGYDGARNDRLRGKRWSGSRLAPDADLEEDLETLRINSRELYRNDTIGGAVESRVANVVGCGFTIQSRVQEIPGVLTRANAKALRKSLEALFEVVSKRLDRNRRRSLWQITRLVERNHAVDGEAFVVLSDIYHPEQPIPLALEVVDADRVETPPSEFNNPNIRLGIERDANGVVIAYYIRRSHPHDTFRVDWTYERVPADRVVHVFEPMFADQSRGIPWLKRVLNKAKDAADLDQATIINAQTQACYTVFVKQTGNPFDAAEGNASETKASGQRLQNLEPGAVTYLGPGEDTTFADPKQPHGNLDPYMQSIYRRIAAGLNFPYEMLMKDWRGTSFAGGRLVLTEARLDFSCKQKLLIEAFLTRVWHRFMDEAVMAGLVDIDPRAYAMQPWLFQRHTWTPPAWPYAISPGEEIAASRNAIDGNLTTLADVLAANGQDLEDILEQRHREVELQRELGVLPGAMPGAAPTQETNDEDTTDEPTPDDDGEGEPS